jgi:hypothetical protein
MNWLQQKSGEHQTPKKAKKPQLYKSPYEQDPWEHLVEELKDNLDPIGGLAEIDSINKDEKNDLAILSKLRPRSSSRSTFMNSHDIRTPPHAVEEMINHPNYAWNDHITEFHPSNRLHILDFERSSIDINIGDELLGRDELDVNNREEVDFHTY